MSVSVLVLTYNEAPNLPRCLASVAWSDDVLVLDSFSTDETVALAEAAGARVMQRAFDDFAGQRNYGVREGGLRHEWVLHLDADEVVTEAMRDELLALAERDDPAVDAYRVPSKMMLHGQWLRYSGMYPTYQVRFGRRDVLTFVQVGHGQREAVLPDRIGTMEEPMLHYSFSKGLDDWFRRHNRYSSDEAEQSLADVAEPVAWSDLAASDPVRRRRALKRLAARLPFRPALRFFYSYVLRRGFLDGRAGYTYARLLATYESMIDLKVRSLRARASHRLPEHAQPTLPEGRLGEAERVE